MKPAARAAAACLLALLFATAAPTPAGASALPDGHENSVWAAEICRMSPGRFKAWLRDRAASAPPAPEQAKDPAAFLTGLGIRVLEDEQLAGRLREITAPVLRFHGLDGSFRFVIFAHHKPLAYTLPGVWTAFSTGLLGRLESEAQLRALAAHEVGHLYFYAEFRKAVEAEDLAGLRQVELGSDAVAAATMVALGEDPGELEGALDMIVNYSPDMQRHNDGTRDYPALAARVETIRRVKDSLAGPWVKAAGDAARLNRPGATPR